MQDVVPMERTLIHKGSKKTHFAELQKLTGIAYQDMIFFDDDTGNIRDVGTLGVICVHTPRGVTRELYGGAVKKWAGR